MGSLVSGWAQRRRLVGVAAVVVVCVVLAGCQKPGTIATIAGNAAHPWPALPAGTHIPVAPAEDAAGNIYVAVAGFESAVYEVAASGAVTTLLDLGGSGFGITGIAAAPDGTIYYSVWGGTFPDTGLGDPAGRIEKRTPDGTRTVIRSNFSPGHPFEDSEALALAPNGHLIAASWRLTSRVVDVDPATGIATVIAGNGQDGFAGDGGPATAAELNQPEGVAVGNDGAVYVADFGNSRVRRIDPATHVITTVGGNGTSASGSLPGEGGPAVDAPIGEPIGLAVGSDGSVYVGSDGPTAVRRIAPDGTLSTIAGTGVSGTTGDGGPATASELVGPRGLTLESNGSLVFIDGNVLRRVAAPFAS
jgi:hypothetical protein